MRTLKTLLAVIALLATATATAAPKGGKYGTAGCGLGSLAFAARRRGPRGDLAISRQNANPCVWGGAQDAGEGEVMTSASELTSRLADLLRNERAALAEFLVVLADFDRRRLWVDLGHASLFYFLHRELGLPKGPAFYRKTAAELIQRYPEIVEPLRDGRLCLTSIVELSKVITPENRADVLPRFFELSKREAKEVSAALLPAAAPPLRDVVTAVRGPPGPLGLPPPPSTAQHPAPSAPGLSALTPGAAPAGLPA